MPVKLAFVFVYMSAFCAHVEAVVGTETTFVLQPGSTITAGGGAQALSGSFTWRDSGAVTQTIEAFNATALNFTSASYTLVLNTTAANDLASDTFADGTTYFAEIVNATGISPSVLEMSSVNSGLFVGDYHNPTLVSYTNVRLVPPNGGAVVGSLNFTAIATPVPEPGSASVAAVAILLFSAHNRRSRRRRG